MRPIAELTDAAREIERTRDPSAAGARPEADDEVAELARTLEGMLAALDEARAETEAMLDRQREFVADASHELRTPLTSVLANLELLTEELERRAARDRRGGPALDAPMRRLVADLLLLARADAGRVRPTAPPTWPRWSSTPPPSSSRWPSATSSRSVAEPVDRRRRRDELHRLVLNLIENAIRHTPPGHQVHARRGSATARPCVLAVEDDGPGIPPELRDRVFERFVRGGGDRAAAPGSGWPSCARWPSPTAARSRWSAPERRRRPLRHPDPARLGRRRVGPLPG